jgi:formylglycine-generating enzyme required for sulfatase activity
MSEYALALSPGSRVEDLIIDSVLGHGSFGITYLVHDETLGTQSALKEYLPRERARRAPDGSVRPISPGDAEAFAEGMERFLHEGRLVAPLDHPNVVKVVRLIRDRETAYLQMPYYDGRPLNNLLRETGTFSDAEIGLLLSPLLDALRYIHAQGVTHRDIKPSNIYVTKTGEPILLDFGAARISAGEASAAHTAIGSEGYAAVEQASSRGRLGPWTDIYGLSATLYRLITGSVPVASVDRADETYHGRPDPLPPLSAVAGGTHSPGLLRAIDRGLAIRASDRPQSIEAWLPVFSDETSAAEHSAHPTPLRTIEPRTGEYEAEGRPWGVYAIVALLLFALLGGGAFVLTRTLDPNESGREDGTQAPTAEQDSADWTRAYTADTPEAYRRYLDDHPFGMTADLARQQLTTFEARSWPAIRTSESIEELERYLTLYPDGENAAAAQGRLDRLRLEEEKARREAEERALRDQEVWERARNRGSEAAMREYLAEFPAGAHAADARAFIHERERARKDDAAWSAARRLDSLRSYQRYLDAFASGNHVAGAMQRLDELTLRPGQVFSDCPDCPSMIVVPAGSMQQGAADGSPLSRRAERPAHPVRLKRAFAVGRHEVTFSQWDACVTAGGCPAAPNDQDWGRGRRPVINVSWNDVQHYASWLSKKTGQVYRLPSESEWEYAARAGETGLWIGGDKNGLCKYANAAGTESGVQWAHAECPDQHAVGTAPTGSYEANAFGLYDVIGNAAEWTQDCVNLSYIDAPADGSSWESGLCSSRVVRGGSWFHGEGDLRLPARSRLRARDSNDFTGFRIVREIED